MSRAIDMCTCGDSREGHKDDGPCRLCGECPRWFPQPQPRSAPVAPRRLTDDDAYDAHRETRDRLGRE